MSDKSMVSNPPASGAAFAPTQGEPARAFEAFCCYHELGPGRRYSVVARKVGASIRSIKRWSSDFDWRGRISSQAARSAEQSVQTQNAIHTAELLDIAARARAFSEGQFLLAEAVIDIAERYVRFPDACRALEMASRLARQARETDATATPDHGLREQLTALLDQACRETPRQAPS